MPPRSPGGWSRRQRQAGSPSACAAFATSTRSTSVSFPLGMTSMATVVALGASWRSSSSRFVPSSLVVKITPVKLAPGRLRLATRPSRTGSVPVANTTGMVVAAALAACAPAVLATITAACRLIRSAREPTAGHYALPPSAARLRHRALRRSRPPSGRGEMRPRGAPESADDVLRRNPITGIVGCCARAASGHAADRQVRAMNSAVSSFDNLVGAGEQRWRNVDAERLRSLEIDHQLDIWSEPEPEVRPGWCP